MMIPAATTWRCRIEWDSPSGDLVLEAAAGGCMSNVRVMLDGEPAEDHPTVYRVREERAPTGPVISVRVAFVPVDGRATFDAIRVEWDGPLGRRHCHCTSVDEVPSLGA